MKPTLKSFLHSSLMFFLFLSFANADGSGYNWRPLHLLYQTNKSQNLIQYKFSFERLKYNATLDSTLSGTTYTAHTTSRFDIIQQSLSYERGLFENFSAFAGINYRNFNYDYSTVTTVKSAAVPASPKYSSTFEGFQSFDFGGKAKFEFNSYEFYFSLPVNYAFESYNFAQNTSASSYGLSSWMVSPTIGMAHTTSIGTPGIKATYNIKTPREVEINSSSTKYKFSGGSSWRADLFYDIFSYFGLYANVQGVLPITVERSINSGGSYSSHATIHELNTWGLGAYGTIPFSDAFKITPEFAWNFKRNDSLDGAVLDRTVNFLASLTARITF